MLSETRDRLSKPPKIDRQKRKEPCSDALIPTLLTP